jgi:fatty acid desaturase
MARDDERQTRATLDWFLGYVACSVVLLITMPVIRAWWLAALSVLAIGLFGMGIRQHRRKLSRLTQSE